MNETEYLQTLQGQPLAARVRGYARLSGPGYMQSAMTLGGGSVASCVVMGSILGYELLWVQPLAILFGFAVLGMVAKQTCHTGERPYQVFWERLHPALALLWGISALIATVIWHFPQYSLTANGVVTLADGAGLNLAGTGARLAVGIVLLASAAGVVYLYGAGARGLRAYENAVKVLVWLIVLAFAVVVFATGVDWRRFALGITGISFLQRVLTGGMPPEAIRPIVGGMAAAVGINMVFLYPYTILKRRWGRVHRELAYFDLVTGMVIPFLVATTFMIVATANTVGPEPGAGPGTAVRDILTLVPVLSATFGQGLSLALIGLGMLAIGFSTIITHMLACGFIGCEIFRFSHDGPAKWWFSLLPAIGVLGVVYPFPWQMAIIASTLAFPLMPVAVVCFIVLLNRADYMGDARPRGIWAWLWNGVLIGAVIVMVLAAGWALRANWQDLRRQLGPQPVEEARGPAYVVPAGALEDSGDGPVDTDLPYGVFTHLAMATDFGISMYGEPGKLEVHALERIALEAFEAVDDLEARISTWRPDSQTSEINRRAAREPVRVSSDMIALLLEAKRICEMTGGYFDVTVGPLIELWGFYSREGNVPSDADIRETLNRVGLDKVWVNERERTVTFRAGGMRLDFGGIGKGLALDRAAAVLRRYGIERALLHSGTSTVLAMGAPPGRPGWTVHIRNPYNAEDYLDTLVVRDAAVSTSACHDRVLEVDGERYCSIFDPVSGRPVDTGLTATAVASEGSLSDALSTAFLVMGRERIVEFCQNNREIRAIYVGVPEDGTPRPERINFAG